ncbi:hypothetical protein like AT1G53590 [Hibiscus trionum]|uniref:C2 domain-containing protein n=1 Tax=Hibiscus trionum TaxID=183268 RepID=A0A9W7MI78_HIBTR|nr:hypothetical protein like AT1G53590 [Hibiscus trionum]
MGLMEISIMLHVGLVLVLLWMLSNYNLCHPVAYFVSLIYLYLVHERYVARLSKKLEFEEKRQNFRRRVLSDSESVRWLNHAVEKIWPICMEQITSQKILLPIIPWFLHKYKPWTVKKAVVQHLYLGRAPPLFTEMRVLRECSDDDHLVLELGMNFLTADDMSAILAVKLRKRLGGMRAKLHVTGMHVEGKVLIGVKFIRKWPFLGRLRVCFAEPPYFQMTVKPVFTRGLDVTELPGIAGWLDKLLSIAFEQTLVEPNMLVVDVEKFASPSSENWFSVDEKQTIGHAKVEVIEASDMKPSDLNGLADPYVKGTLGPYRFRTKTQKKTLSPKWHEEYMIPICSWETPNVMVIEVRDKDHLFDDTLGNCSVNVTELRGGQRYDMWLPLQNIKMGRLHLAITVLEDNAKGSDDAVDAEALNKEDIQISFAAKDADNGSFSPMSSKKSATLPDHLEPIDVEGQEETGIWVHHPGSEVSQTWEPRKGKDRSLETQIHRLPNGSFGNTISAASGSIKSDDNSSEENPNSKNRANIVKQGLRKIGSVFQRSPKSEGYSGSLGEVVPSPHENLRAVNDKDVLVKFVVDDNLSADKASNEGSLSPGGSSAESPRKMKGMARSILKHAGNSASSIKHVFSRKGSKKSRNLSAVEEQEYAIESDSDDDDDDSLSSPGVDRTTVLSNHISSSSGNDDPHDAQEHVILADSNNQLNPETNVKEQVERMTVEGHNEIDDNEVDSPVKLGNGTNEPIPKPSPSEGNLEFEKKVEYTPQTDTKV